MAIITFSTRAEKFDSAYERNKFFRGLYGWEQAVKKYRYRRPGLLDEIPHRRISDSVFMVAMEDMRQVMEYFDQWQEKVEWEMMEMMMERERFLKNLRNKKSVDNVEGD